MNFAGLDAFFSQASAFRKMLAYLSARNVGHPTITQLPYTQLSILFCAPAHRSATLLVRLQVSLKPSGIAFVLLDRAKHFVG